MSALVEQTVPYPRRVFCNRNLRLDKIRFVGFDMDYTLALYSQAMEELQARLGLRRLVERFGYPPEALSLRYDPEFAIRGLTVDLVHGNVFKMDAHRFVGRVWHGVRPLDKAKRRAIYTNRRVAPSDPDFVMVDTLFSLPEISLYAQLVDLLDARAPAAAPPDYERLWHDLRASMDSIHRDGSLKAQILADLSRYVLRCPELAETLHRFRSAGQKLFLLTNSEPSYTRAVMSYLLDGVHDDYPSWMDYFHVIVTSARKPVFFDSEQPFFEVDDADRPHPEPATALRRGRIYAGGNVEELGRLTGMVGEDVLYVGDHIYGDILRSKRRASWRTAMIIQEMEDELTQLQAHVQDVERVNQLDEERFQLNLERAAQRVHGDEDRALRDRAHELTRELRALEDRLARSFNPRWGMLFRDRAEHSAFGEQVEDYACVYTAKVSNFRLYSPQWYFRSPRDRMAHEIRL